jgi:hypothetical protein
MSRRFDGCETPMSSDCRTHSRGYKIRSYASNETASRFVFVVLIGRAETHGENIGMIEISGLGR